MSPLAALWMAIGTLLVLLGPGWAWSYTVFPASRPLRAPRTRPRELDLVERAAVALALSLALVPFGAIVWNGMLRLPLSTPWAIAYVLALSAAGLAVARFWHNALGPRSDPNDAPDELEQDDEATPPPA